MKEFQERRVLRKYVFSKITFIFLSVLAVFLAYSTIKIYLRSRDAVSANQLVEKEIKDLNAKKSELSDAVKRLQTEEGAEQEIRSKFPVQKPGENAVIIVNSAEKNKIPTGNVSQSGFFEKIWQFIKSIF